MYKAKVKTLQPDMKRIVYALFILTFFMPWMPQTNARAETQVTPDIRTSDIFVKKRLMPQSCGYSLPEWIEMYVGYNKIVQDEIKTYTDFASDANQMDRVADRTCPYSVCSNASLPKEEKGNKPSWNASICYYTDGGNGQIPSEDLIVSEGEIPESSKKIRGGARILAALFARGHESIKGQQYDMKQPDVAPNPNTPRACSEKPPGVTQKDIKKTNTGLNPFNFNFVNDITLNGLCNALGNPCQCVMTEMWIKPDSTNQYASYTGCTLAGCVDENGVQAAVKNTDPAHQADTNAQESGGFGNVFRPSIMLQLFAFVETIIGNSVGVVTGQETENKQGTRTEPASWSFTKEWEVSVDFINCKLFPYAFRSKMPECNTNWLERAVNSAKNQIQGSGNQLITEPVQEMATPAGMMTQ